MPIVQNKAKLNYETIVSNEIITLTNPNTTLGFVRFKNTGAIEYIYVQPMYRRLGLANILLEKVRTITGKEIFPEPPISPLGIKLFKL
jgi:ribosomal protein S18 acetylase RimI-like enzyme